MHVKMPGINVTLFGFLSALLTTNKVATNYTRLVIRYIWMVTKLVNSTSPCLCVDVNDLVYNVRTCMWGCTCIYNMRARARSVCARARVCGVSPFDTLFYDSKSSREIKQLVKSTSAHAHLWMWVVAGRLNFQSRLFTPVPQTKSTISLGKQGLNWANHTSTRKHTFLW